MSRIILFLALTSFLFGCSLKYECPKQDILLKAMTPVGPITIFMEKGYLNDEFKGKTWIPAKESKKPKEEKKDAVSK